MCIGVLVMRPHECHTQTIQSASYLLNMDSVISFRSQFNLFFLLILVD